MGFKNRLEEVAFGRIKYDEPMKKHTTFNLGGVAKYYVEVDSLYLLKNLEELAKSSHVPYKVIGNGSNILVSEKGYRGIIINLAKLSDVFFKRNQVCAMAGASLGKLLQFCYTNKLTGLEELSGIPASVGGAVVMNAGAFGKSISDGIQSVQTINNGKLVTYDKFQCRFGYRTSRFFNKRETVVSVLFNLDGADKEIISAKTQNYIELRKSAQPMGRTCGSVFKNPKNAFAGEIIDKIGLKGIEIGGAKVSEKHANFITVKAGATSSDVYRLIGYVKEKVKEKTGIILKEEVEYLGEF